MKVTSRFFLSLVFALLSFQLQAEDGTGMQFAITADASIYNQVIETERIFIDCNGREGFEFK